MSEISKSHHSSTRLSMLLVMLGVCVFFWGLGYKLSLYDFHRASIHRIPEAKLLSRNEDPDATDSVRLCLAKSESSQQTSAYTFMIFFLLAGGIAGLKAGWDRQYFGFLKPWCLCSQAILSALFVKPPPAISGL
ncbi:MAG: hypothetical protein WA354_22270 [Terracidiphilus sp.]